MQNFVLVVLFGFLISISNSIFSEENGFYIEIENDLELITGLNSEIYDFVHITNNKNINNNLILPSNITFWNYRSIGENIYENNFTSLKMKNGFLFWLNTFRDGKAMLIDYRYTFYIGKTESNNNKYHYNYASPVPLRTLNVIPNSEDTIEKNVMIDYYFSCIRASEKQQSLHKILDATDDMIKIKDLLNSNEGKGIYWKLRNKKAEKLIKDEMYFDFCVADNMEIISIISIKNDIIYKNNKETEIIEKGTEIWSFKKDTAVKMEDIVLPDFNVDSEEMREFLLKQGG